MRADEILDSESLQFWLWERPEASSRQEAIKLTRRMALRVFPQWAARMDLDWTVEFGISSLPLLRAILISGVAIQEDDEELRNRSRVAAHVLLSSMEIARKNDIGVFLHDYDTAALMSAMVLEMSYGGYDGSHAHKASHVIALAANTFHERAIDSGHARLKKSKQAWEEVQADATCIEDQIDLRHRRLWSGQIPDWFNRDTLSAYAIWNADPPGTWDFWKRWYRCILDGKPMDPALERDIALIPDADWKMGPAHIAGLIAAIEKLHHPTTLSRAALADFEFVDVLRHMKMVGFADDLAHLRDPQVVQAFLDDMAEVSDGLQDVLDYSAEARTKGNSCAMACVAIEKVLRELSLAKDSTHLRARRLIQLAGDVQMFSQSPDAQMAFGNLADKLDDRLSTLRAVCRKHFGPSLMRLAVLKDLALGQLDPGEMLVALRHVVDRIVARDGRDFPRLAPEAVAVLRDMLDELDSTRTAIAEAQTAEHRETLRKRFAESFGGTTATVGRYVEKAAPHAAKATERVDGAIRAYKRWENLSDMVDWLRDLFF